MVNVLTVLWQGALVAGFLLTGFRFLTHRHPESRDVFLMFGTLIGLVLSSWTQTIYGLSLGVLSGVLLWAHPYMMLRVVDRFQPVGERVMQAAGWALVGGWILVLAFPSPRPGPVTLVLVAYFVIAEMFAASLLMRGAVSSVGATRRRLGLAGMGTFLLGAAIFISIGSNYVELAPVVESQMPVVLVVVGFASFYVGFAPPRLLSLYWEYQTVQSVAGSAADGDGRGGIDATIDAFEEAVRSLLDPDGIVLILQRSGAWEIQGDVEHEALPMSLGSNGSIMERSMEVGSSIVDRDAAMSPHWEGDLVRKMDGTGLVAIPIVWQEKPRGVCLAVFRRLPLFVDETAGFLALWGKDVARSLDLEALAKKRERDRVELLQREKEALQEADRIKDEFLATMSHEIRTPVTSVLGTVDLLSQTPLTREQRDHLETVANSGNHLLTIIDDLLSISKISAGEMEIDERPTSIEDLVKGCVDASRSKAQEKGLDLSYEVRASEHDVVWIDPDWTRQILSNLVSNAIKFTHTGHVAVRAGMMEENGSLVVCLDVEDSGIGIPSEMMETIFDPFQQADTSTTREHEGTGLGLSITKKLVDRMDGEIAVDSIVEEGTTVHVRIPVGRASEMAVESVTEARGTKAPRPAPSLDEDEEPLGILLVEDNKVNRRVAQEMLSNRGHEVQTAPSGQAALQALSEKRFDVVLLDLQMPGMDGFEVAERIHEQHEEHERPYLIALTAHVGPTYRQKALRVGMKDYLTKPIRIDALEEALTQARANIPPSGDQSSSQPGRGRSGPGETNEASGEECIVDADQIASLQENITPEGFREIVKVFMEEAPELLSKIKTASKDGDLEAVSQHAHALKGVAASVGAQRLAAFAATLEEAPRSDRTGEPLKELDEAWAKTAIQLEASIGDP